VCELFFETAYRLQQKKEWLICNTDISMSNYIFRYVDCVKNGIDVGYVDWLLLSGGILKSVPRTAFFWCIVRPHLSSNYS
jgi:hypothetical protein